MKKLVTNVLAVDDLDGVSAADHTVTLTLADGTYTLDLSAEHELELRTLLERYLSHAQFAALPAATGPSAADLDASSLQMREWARQNLKTEHIPSRGPLPRAIVDAYRTQHPEEVDPDAGS